MSPDVEVEVSSTDEPTGGRAYDQVRDHLVGAGTHKNPEPEPRYNLVVLGGGSAGLVAAVGAAGLGAKVALVERSLLGGDCLNTGCVPSKALIRAGHAADAMGRGRDFGLVSGPVQVDGSSVLGRIRRTRSEIAPHDSAERLAKLGVHVFFGNGQFVGPDTVEVDGAKLRFARALIATGAAPWVPPIDGLERVRYLTSDSVFDIDELPRRLLVIGAGPIGCELAQAFARLGSQVHLIEAGPRIMANDDPEAAAIVESALGASGVQLHLNARVDRVETTGGRIVATLDGDDQHLEADQILLAVGRKPRVDGMGLAEAGIRVEGGRIVVDDRLRTSNRRVYVSGDAGNHLQFTHAADAQSRMVLQNALFFGRKKASDLLIPWCTYTDPEVAHVGAQAGHQSFSVAMEDVDRVIIDGDGPGLAKIHVDRKGRIVGATMVSRHAGESIGEMALAISTGTKAGQLSSVVHPYPTQAEVWRRLGDAYQRTRLTRFWRRVFRKLLAWRRS